MAFVKNEYINEYNKEKYKMYQFRIKKSETNIISHLDNTKNRNSYISSLIKKEITNDVYTIKNLKSIIKPILLKYGINDVYLFGSYARGEANVNSDVDIYCEKGNIKTLIDQGFLEDELKEALKKDVDVVFVESSMSEYFKERIMGDLIKLC